MPYDQFSDRQLENLQRVETPLASITLTRTALLAIFAVGTDIIWQSQIRGAGITWSGTDITIPTAGMYAFTVRLSLSAAATMQFRFTINGTNLTGNWGFNQGASYHTASVTRYFATGDIVRINVIPQVNCNLLQSAEGTLLESPILYVTQLTGAIPA